MFVSLSCYKYVIPVCLGLFFLFACQSQSPEFVVTETGQSEIQATAVVEIDNCDNWLPTTETYRYPYAGQSVGVENLVPNGGEPFRSIRKHIWDMYGEPVDQLTLSVPAQTKQEFTLLITRYNYRGIVEGDVIDANKINVLQDAVYFYPFNADITIEGQRNIPCTP